MTLVGYDERDNIISYYMDPMSIAEVIKDKGDHYDMTF